MSDVHGNVSSLACGIIILPAAVELPELKNWQKLKKGDRMGRKQKHWQNSPFHFCKKGPD
jgi:hypothetical protein